MHTAYSIIWGQFCNVLSRTEYSTSILAYSFCVTTESARPACSIIWFGSLSSLGGKTNSLKVVRSTSAWPAGINYGMNVTNDVMIVKMDHQASAICQPELNGSWWLVLIDNQAGRWGSGSGYSQRSRCRFLGYSRRTTATKSSSNTLKRNFGFLGFLQVSRSTSDA